MEQQPPERMSLLSTTNRPVLRKDNIETPKAWLLGNLLQDLAPKKGSQLPTNGDVLRFFVFLNREPMQKDKREDVIKYVILKVEEFWELSGIPTTPIRAGHSKRKLSKLISEYENLRKHKTRKNFKVESESFLKSLLVVFDIAHDNAIAIIEHDRCRNKRMILQDLQFLEDQRSCRKLELGGLDKAHFAKVLRKQSRNEHDIERKVKEKRRREEASTTITSLDSLEPNDLDPSPCSNEDPDFLLPSTCSGATGYKLGRKSLSIALTLPRNPFTSKTISAMGDRLNLSAGKRTAFMGAILSEGGVLLDEATLSIKSTWAAGKKVRKLSAQEIKKTFVAPKHSTLHWDGKLVPDFKKEKKERLGILVSGMPDFEEGKLLGIPVITKTTGEEQARATFSLANEWNLSNNVRSLVFDTTASNSGWKIGACVQLEKLLDKKVFMLACRHHIFERILCSVHKELFGATSGPENTNFVQFRDSIWKTINKEGDYKILQIKDRSLKIRKEILIQSLKRILSDPNRKNVLPRADYRECAELMLILLGEHLNEEYTG